MDEPLHDAANEVGPVGAAPFGERNAPGMRKGLALDLAGEALTPPPRHSLRIGDLSTKLDPASESASLPSPLKSRNGPASDYTSRRPDVPSTLGERVPHGPGGTQSMMTFCAVLCRFPCITDIFPGLSCGLLNIAFEFTGRLSRDLSHCLVDLALHLLSNAFDLVLVHNAVLRKYGSRRANQIATQSV